MIKENGVLISAVSDEDLDLLKTNPDEFWSGVTSIGRQAFYLCEELTEINIPNGVTRIEAHAFDSCTNLINVNMADDVSFIGEFAFNDCKNLTNVKMGKSVKQIGRMAFRKCRNLTNITMPEGLTSIGENAFESCRNLTSINIPDGLNSIGDDAFTLCKNLKYLIRHGKKIKILGLCDGLPIIINKHFSDEYIIEHAKSMLPASTWEAMGGLNLREYKNLLSNYGTNKETKELTVAGHNLVDLVHFGYNLGLFSNETIKVKNSSGKVQELPVSNVAFNVIQKMLLSGMKLDLMHTYFQDMQMQEYNEHFLRFMQNKTNLEEIIAEERRNSGFITRVYSWFNERAHLQNLGEVETASNRDRLPTSEANRYKIQVYDVTGTGINKLRWHAPTVEALKKEFVQYKYTGVTAEKRHIAEYLSEFSQYSEQKFYDKAAEIDDERINAGVPNSLTTKTIKQSTMDAYREYFAKTERIKREILETADQAMIEQKESADQIFSYEMLSKDSEEIFALGFMTSCCATLYGAGAGAMRAVITSPDMQPLVIRDSKDNIIAFGIVYVNRKQGYAVVNDFEVNNKYFGNDKALKAIYKKAMQGIDAFARAYNEDNPKKPIRVAHCGISPNWTAISDFISENPKSEILKAPNFDKWKYAGSGSWPGDWHDEQYRIWQMDKNNNLEV